MRNGRRIAALMIAGLLSAAACSSGGRSGQSSSSGPRPGAPRDGGTLRMGIDKVPSLDPADASPGSEAQQIVADLLFDGLTSQPAGSDAPQPAIAASWTSSPDQRVWTFALRNDAVFSNGRGITAADVKYSLERVAKQGETTLPGIRLEIITGYHDFLAGTAPEIVGIKATAPSTLEIDLDAPFAMLPSLLAAPSYGIVPKEAVEAASPAFKTAPVGSGPFAYAGTDTTSGTVVRLVRSRATSAHLEAIELHEYDDVNVAYTDFTSGKLDWSLVPAAKAGEAIAAYGNSGFQPFHAVRFYAINVLDPTFADVRFRQAIMKAINATAIVRAVYPDVADPLGGLIPTGIAGHVDNPCGQPCAYDVDGAKALLAQTFPSGPPPLVNIDYEDGTDEAAVAGAIAAQLNAVGIPTANRPHPADQYAQFAVSGQQQLFELGWIGFYDDPDAYLYALFATGSRDNATGIGSPPFDDLVRQERATADARARLPLDQQAEQQLLALAPVVPIAQFRTRVVVTKQVHDLAIAIDGTFAGSQVWLG